MKIKPFRQTTWDSCLAVCLLLLARQKVTRQKEISLLIDSLKGPRDSFALSLLEAFVKKYKRDVEVYADNKAFCSFLKSRTRSPKIHLKHKFIDKNFIEEHIEPFILYVDGHFLKTPTHYPHFVIIEGETSKKYLVIDPWIGNRRKVPKSVIYDAVGSLKDYLKFCPLMIVEGG